MTDTLWGIIGYNAQRIDTNPRIVYASYSRWGTQRKWLSLRQKARQGMTYRMKKIKIEGEQ